MDAKELLSTGWTETAIKSFLPAPTLEDRYSRIYGSYTTRTWNKDDVRRAKRRKACHDYFVQLATKRMKSKEVLQVDLLDAVREASRSAHRWRDRAEESWNYGSSKYAGTCAKQKRYWYSLKERGIVALHKTGILRYSGTSPQGMAVYEYGDGGMACLHSTLHPLGFERKPVVGHPEILKVAAKKQKLKLRDVEATLKSLPEVIFDPGYERSASPSIPREPRTITCYLCGGDGHIARNCPECEDTFGEDCAA